jgi:DDB1- and CUL4-associated factor 11
MTRSLRRSVPARFRSKALGCDGCEDEEHLSHSCPTCETQVAVMPSQTPLSVHTSLRARESGLCAPTATCPRFKSAAQDRFLPRVPTGTIDATNSRAYCGKFSTSGDRFLAAFQARRIRLYDSSAPTYPTTNNPGCDQRRGSIWPAAKDIEARMLQWTITDCSLAPDEHALVYSTLAPVVHLVRADAGGATTSISNITEVHEALLFDHGDMSHGFMRRRGAHFSFGIWSCRWSPDSKELVAATSLPNLLVMDLSRRETVARSNLHGDDVNATCWHGDSPDASHAHVLVSGSDDTLVRLYDRRLMDDSGTSRPVGYLPGHIDGITSVASRGDGRYLVTNGKDQSAKLWDVRSMLTTGGDSPSSLIHCPVSWDYRWEDYPAAGLQVRHPKDASVMTYRGHSVHRTLIRAYFSPPRSTGQRYIYTGDAEGDIVIFDVLSGRCRARIRAHRETVRDLDWHPDRMQIASVGFDGRVCRWDAGRDDQLRFSCTSSRTYAEA